MITNMEIIDWQQIKGIADENMMISVDIIKLNVFLSELERSSKYIEVVVKIYNILSAVYNEERATLKTLIRYNITVKDIKSTFTGYEKSLPKDLFGTKIIL